MTTIDLDIAKKARESKDPLTVRFKGKSFTVPKNMPYKIFRKLDELDEIAGMELILDALLKERKDEFLELDPDIEDVGELVEGVFKAMRRKVGEAAEDSSDS